MARGKTETEQFGPSDRIDAVRRELDAKIDGKISYVLAAIIVGPLIALIVLVVSNLNSQIISLNTRLDEMGQRLTVIETKMGIKR